jgi:hypothetical protein
VVERAVVEQENPVDETDCLSKVVERAGKAFLDFPVGNGMSSGERPLEDAGAGR